MRGYAPFLGQVRLINTGVGHPTSYRSSAGNPERVLFAEQKTSLGQDGPGATGTVAIVVVGVAILGVLAYSMDLFGGK